MQVCVDVGRPGEAAALGVSTILDLGLLFHIVEFFFILVNFYNKSKTLHINENKRIKWRLC